MFARVTLTNLKPNTTLEASRLYRESVVPAVSKLPGFEGALFLTDETGSKTIAIAIWKSKADLEAGDASGFYREQLAKFAHLVAQPPMREVYEVTVRE